MEEKKNILADFLKISSKKIKIDGNSFHCDNGIFEIFTEEEADMAIIEKIKSSIYTMDAEFIMKQCYNVRQRPHG